MMNRLSGNSLRLRVGLGVGMLAGAGTAWFVDWGWTTFIVAVIAGSYAAYKVGNQA